MFNMSIIEHFLDQILNITYYHDFNLSSYIINWISCLIQKTGIKTETALFILGEQGTGKNKFLTDAISKQFGRYAIIKENCICKIIGKT
jgi:uncharacterized membrane protein YczE